MGFCTAFGFKFYFKSHFNIKIYCETSQYPAPELGWICYNINLLSFGQFYVNFTWIIHTCFWNWTVQSKNELNLKSFCLELKSFLSQNLDV